MDCINARSPWLKVLSHHLLYFFCSLAPWRFCLKEHNAIKDPHWYAVQVSDTTMLPMAASLPG